MKKKEISPINLSNFEAAREAAFDDMEREKIFVSRQLETKDALFDSFNIIKNEKIISRKSNFTNKYKTYKRMYT